MLRRAVIPIKGGGTGGFRGVDDIPTTPNTVPGGIPKVGSGTPGSGTSGSGTPRIGKDGDAPSTYKPPVINEGDAFTPPNQQGTGTASSSTNLCARNKNTCDDMKDVAEELVEQIVDAIEDAAEPETPSADEEPTAIAVTATLSRSTVTPAPTPMPNLNMSSWMDMYDYRGLFTEEEYSMLQDDPLCFYANFGRLYEDYASESRTSTGSTSATSSSSSSITTGSAKRTAQPGPRDDDSLGYDYVGDGDDAEDPATATGVHEGDARTLYLTFLPDQLRLVYTSTPTSLTVTATATTTCSGLNGLGISDFETPYAVFGYREGYAPTETASVGSANEATSVGASLRAEMMPWTGLAMLGLLWLSRLI